MDQEDAEGLMQLARQTLGYGKKEKRFPKKETLHYVYSRHVNTEIGVVSLGRTVKNDTVRQQVAADTLKISGVSRVENRISIQ